jgi:hypothetical protein
MILNAMMEMPATVQKPVSVVHANQAHRSSVMMARSAMAQNIAMN